jgi:hypothetical protein
MGQERAFPKHARFDIAMGLGGFLKTARAANGGYEMPAGKLGWASVYELARRPKDAAVVARAFPTKVSARSTNCTPPAQYSAAFLEG